MLQRAVGHPLFPHTQLTATPHPSFCHITHWTVAFLSGNVSEDDKEESRWKGEKEEEGGPGTGKRLEEELP